MRYFVLNFLSMFWNFFRISSLVSFLFWWSWISIFFSSTRKRDSESEYRIFSPSFSPKLDFSKRVWASVEFDVILSEIRVALILGMIIYDFLSYKVLRFALLFYSPARIRTAVTRARVSYP